MGTIVILAESKSKRLSEIPEPQTHFEYMNTISSYYNEGYYFDTYILIQQAIAQYPEFKIYPVLLENLLLE